MSIMILICSTIYALYVFLDLTPLYHQKKLKEFWVYLVMFAISYTLYLLYELGVNLPNPSAGITKLVSLIWKQ